MDNQFPGLVLHFALASFYDRI